MLTLAFGVCVHGGSDGCHALTGTVGGGVDIDTAVLLLT